MKNPTEQQPPIPNPAVERREFLGGAAALAGTSQLGLSESASGAAADIALDRFPPIPADKMTEEQKKAAEELAAGTRGGLSGPFIPLLRSPGFMTRLQKAGAYLRYETKLGGNITEFVILLTARHWTQQFEWDTHEPIAKQSGIKLDVIAAIAEGRRPSGMSADAEILHDFCTELLHHQSVCDATYARGKSFYGKRSDRYHRAVRILLASGHDHECLADADARGENTAISPVSSLTMRVLPWLCGSAARGRILHHECCASKCAVKSPPSTGSITRTLRRHPVDDYPIVMLS